MLKNKYILTYFIGAILIFNSGWIDSVVLYKSFGASVAAMTGNFRILGHSLSEVDFRLSFQVLMLVIGFVIGSIINGILIRSNPYILSKSLTKSLVIQSSIMLIGTLALDAFSDSQIIDDIFLAMAMGMQNSFTTLFFGSFARTTHMTGTTTDLGIEIGRAISSQSYTPWKIPFFAFCILIFTLGNTGGAIWVHISGEHYTFMLFPSVILPIFVGFVILMMYKFESKIHKSFL